MKKKKKWQQWLKGGCLGVSKKTHPGWAGQHRNTVPLRLHLHASWDAALPAGSKRPMLIRQEAFDTTPWEGSTTISRVPGGRRGSSGQTGSRLLTPSPPHRSCPEPPEPPAGGREESEGGQEPTRPGNASWDSPSLLGRATTQAPHPGVSVGGNRLTPKLQKGHRESSKVQTALRFLHCTGFYRDSKGTNEKDTLGSVQREAGQEYLTTLQRQALEKILITKQTCRAIGGFHYLVGRTLTKPGYHCFCMTYQYSRVYQR